MAKQQLTATERIAQQVDELGTAIFKIADDPDGSFDEAQDLISALLEETRVSLEELRVADEELHQQNEELIASRAALEAQRHHYHELFDLAPVGYLLTDSVGTIRESNQAAANLLNVRLDYLIGKPLAVFVPDEHRASFRIWLLEAELVNTVRVWETYLQPRHTPEPRDILLTVAYVLDADEVQKDIRLRWLLYDITDRKKAEAAERDQYFHETFERAAVGIAHSDRNTRYLRVNQKMCDMLGYSREELVHLSALDITVADDLPETRNLVQQLVDGTIDSASMEKRYLRKDGSTIWVDVNASSVFDTLGHYAYTITVLNDITESKRLIAAERKQRALTDAVRKTATILTSTLNLEEVLDHIVETTGQIVPYDGASILLVDEDPLDVHVERGWGDISEIIPEFEKFLAQLKTPSAKHGVFYDVVNTNLPLIIPDVKDYLPPHTASPIGAIHSLIIVPIIARDVIIGYMELHSAALNFFSSLHSEHLQIFASQAAVAIQNARAYLQGQTLAALEERQRLARDLHDAVTQTLFTSSVISEALLRADKNKPEKIWPHLETLHLLNRGAIAEMRTLLIELRPEYLLKLPISIQLQQLIDAVKSRKLIDIQLTINEEHGLPIPNDVQIAMYRVTQEALTNIVKHSSASAVEVIFDNTPDLIRITIADNGVGFNVEESVNSVGMGLTNMQERASSIHADLHIINLNGSGAQITLTWNRKN